MPDTDKTTATLTDYDRGYRDGVAAASVQIADHYRAMQQRARKAESEISTANRMMESLVLAEFAPLQDRVNRLRSSEGEYNDR